MGAIPSSMIAAIATSAAAGKNPWLPLALIFLLAAPDGVPSLMMDPDLHRQLHALGPVEVLWTLGAVFGLLAIADSLADKVGFIEKWLVPVSTAWRPFAGIACATLVGVAAARDATSPDDVAAVQEAVRLAATDTRHASLLVGGSVVALTVSIAAVFGWIATVGKTGARLVMSMIPVPGLKLAHSFLDDFFALGASIAGLAFADTILVPVLLALYLAVGLVTGPLLTRLALIHVRIGWGLLKKAWASVDDAPAALPTPPRWVTRWLDAQGLSGATILPGYVYRAPELGRCRAGHLVLAGGTTAFLTRVWWSPKALVLDEARLARVGFADTATSRVVTLVERMKSEALREVHVYLYPAVERAVLPVLEGGAARAGLVRVKKASASARAGLPGYADRDRSVRFLPESEAGSLRLQGLVTIATAIIVGILTGGVFIPIGAGYLLSPFKKRFVLGLAISGYLALCVVGSMGLGWPAAVLYASILNVLTLRDLTRNALKARVDGFVDKRAWLPLVATRVWVPKDALRTASDRLDDDATEPLGEGSWRAVASILAEPPAMLDAG